MNTLEIIETSTIKELTAKKCSCKTFFVKGGSGVKPSTGFPPMANVVKAGNKLIIQLAILNFETGFTDVVFPKIYNNQLDKSQITLDVTYTPEELTTGAPFIKAVRFAYDIKDLTVNLKNLIIKVPEDKTCPICIETKRRTKVIVQESQDTNTSCIFTNNHKEFKS